MHSRVGTIRSSPAKPASVARIPASETTVLSRQEFERIKAASKLVTPDQIARERKALEETRAAQQAAARERKERMIRMEQEAARNVPPTDIEESDKREAEGILARAQTFSVEGRDEVKKMNEIMRYAKCAAIRERQLEEKKQSRVEERVEDRAWASLMEADRLRALTAQEEVERQKVEKRQADAKVLRQQIHDRETQRLREQEAAERERELMQQRLEEERQAELAKEEQRRVAGKRLLEEGARANREAAAAKEHEKLAEKMEDLKIVQYEREREQREREREEEQVRIKAEKEMETCRLRAMQEKAIDKQAIRDSLLARRAQEKSEREWRAKQKAEAEKAAAMQADLARAREDQIRARENALREAVIMEKVDFERALQVQRSSAEDEERRAAEANERALRNQQAVRDQIESTRERFERERAQKLAEGEALRRRMAQEKEVVERARREKIEALRQEGIPEKYMADLARSKF
ncbi:putative Cilia- and flagella-associated protein 45 [Paratrimastix pyriformis]|uniref:Cilia- and flagella-associated protein 45 n=1 Tax=Paratrimastix pyriformis TaxID=342808 RepID=A0ABQ8UL05_9EUKA|nr:putative Cilia- and flagella-associated protein 45 [Paratrimastix pyriformis]|eukprot:GAFH01001630.1.p1 GENE.GAFH01001630.1~~GAFH01001630.1.p1  ORF type:complete len:477 (-),score=157.63 GAFH01001630.1:89-1495(-)